jgi:hypothetical protein
MFRKCCWKINPLQILTFCVNFLKFSDRFAVGQNVATTWSFEKEAPNKDSPEFRRHIKGESTKVCSLLIKQAFVYVMLTYLTDADRC